MISFRVTSAENKRKWAISRLRAESITLTFCNTDSVSFSLFIILMATRFPDTHCTPSFTSPAKKREEEISLSLKGKKARAEVGRQWWGRLTNFLTSWVAGGHQPRGRRPSVTVVYFYCIRINFVTYSTEVFTWQHWVYKVTLSFTVDFNILQPSSFKTIRCLTSTFQSVWRGGQHCGLLLWPE